MKAAGGGGSCKEAAEQHQRNPRARGTCQQPRAAIRARRRAACYTRPAGFRLQQHPVRQRDSTPPTPWSPTAQNSLALESSVISHTNNKTNGCGYEHGQYSTDDVTTTTAKLQARSSAAQVMTSQLAVYYYAPNWIRRFVAATARGYTFESRRRRRHQSSSRAATLEQSARPRHMPTAKGGN